MSKSPEEGVFHSDRWNEIKKKVKWNLITPEISPAPHPDLDAGGKSSFCMLGCLFLSRQKGLYGGNFGNDKTKHNTSFSTSAPCKYTIAYTNKHVTCLLQAQGDVQTANTPLIPTSQVQSHVQRPCCAPRWASLIWPFPSGSASLMPHLSL